MTVAQTTPKIAPTRLEFDGRRALKTCNDEVTFGDLLGNWVPDDVMISDADRKLVVRLRRGSKGETLADLSIMDAAGVVVAEEHKTYGAPGGGDCFKVLYDVAYQAATLLGAFEKPPTPEPIVCPMYPACATCNEPKPCPALPALQAIVATTALAPREPLRRFFVGAGVILGHGLWNQATIGPLVTFGFIPSRQSPQWHFELTGGWTTQTSQHLQAQTIPMFLSLCHSRNVFRLCGGMASTFLSTTIDGMWGTALAGMLRMGAEFGIAGPMSMRLDGYLFGRLGQRGIRATDEWKPTSAAIAAMGVWGWE